MIYIYVKTRITKTIFWFLKFRYFYNSDIALNVIF